MKIFHVDTFTDRAFRGNPAGVCILSHPKVDSWMQSVAAEMNLSEIAFLIRQADGYLLRWFTPKTEVDLCGHATLASAHILWQETLASADSHINFYTRSGNLRAWRQDDRIGLDFPLLPDEPIAHTEDLRRILGTPIVYAGKNRFDTIVEVGSEEILRSIGPARDELLTLITRGLIITSRSDNPEYDFVSRFFRPSAGEEEIPVSGSAHCCLGPYWAMRLGRDVLTAYQASLRGGMIGMAVTPDRIHLYGHAVTVIAGEIVT
ncbi:MAG: PhzF family phenazine biosynthesis protein [Syntrophorhabdus sp.]